MILNEQVKFYQEKLKKDKKLRIIEVQKVQKQKEIEELYKNKEIDTIRAVILSLNREEKILDFEEKKKVKTQIFVGLITFESLCFSFFYKN